MIVPDTPRWMIAASIAIFAILFGSLVFDLDTVDAWVNIAKGLAAAVVAEVAYKTFKHAHQRYQWRRRSKSGTSTNLDANDLIYAHWGTRRRSDWNDTNGRVPHSDAMKVLMALGPPLRLSATVITRWVYSNEDPNLLPVFVRAGFTDDDITNFMHANEEDRAAIQVVAALAAGSS
jgi:hypothetical protein